MKVNKWKGTFTIEFKTSASQDPQGLYKPFSGSMDRSASGSFEVEGSGTPRLIWEGDGTAKIKIDDEGIHGHPRHNWHYVASSRASGESTLAGEVFRPRVTINPVECTYGIALGQMHASVQRTTLRTDFGTTTTETEDQYIRVQITELPLPERGLVIQDRKRLPVDDFREGRSAGATFFDIGATSASEVSLWSADKPPEGIVTWKLAPADVEEYVLEVELEGYDQWEPQASADQTTPGNDITAVARLKTRDGKAPEQKAKQFIFELIDVSSVPGVAMNYPPSRTASRDPDLRLHQDKNRGHVNVVDQRGQRAETRPDSEVTEVRAVISSHDWGAFGKLKVTAIMPDEQRIAGHLKGDRRRTQILIPKRQDNSKIADHAKQRAGVAALADDDDSDNDPDGDGYKGDGLTLYEEYRGFYVNGQHIRTNPNKKNLFVHSKIGRPSEQGILRFQSETGLQVYYKLAADELGSDRVMNFNHGGQIPHLGDQHGLLMRTYNTTSLISSAVSTTKRPGTPKDISEITISSRANPAWPDYPNVIAHELAHSVNVPHHGDKDIRQQKWIVDKTTNPGRLMENGVVITVKRENGALLKLENPNVSTFTIYLGMGKGEHSGDQRCFMRYAASQAYKSSADASVRYWTNKDETRGPILSESHQGTGINLAGRNPQSRYGDADRGNCKARVRVKDM